MEHLGVCPLPISHDGHTKSYKFHVVDVQGPTILGLPTCRDMKLVTLNYSITAQPDIPAERKRVGDPVLKKKILQANLVLVCKWGCKHQVTGETSTPEKRL